MEMVYPRVPKTDIAEVYLREVGAGRVVYFPWDIDRIFWEVLAVDHGLLLAQRRAVGDRRGAAGRGQGPRRARRDRLAAGGLDDRAPGQPDEPDDDEGPVPRADPGRRAAGDGPAPRRAKARRVQLLVAGREVPVAQDGTRLSVTVPSIRDLEVVAIDL